MFCNLHYKGPVHVDPRRPGWVPTVSPHRNQAVRRQTVHGQTLRDAARHHALSSTKHFPCKCFELSCWLKSVSKRLRRRWRECILCILNCVVNQISQHIDFFVISEMFYHLHIADCHSLQTQRLRQISSSGSHFDREEQKHRLHSSVPQAGQAALPARRGGLRLHQRHLLTGNTS